ncbi:hypothetical protein QOZ80_4AG0309910 [Eleusine coracana subsp. coracana]|nr:hypothetical protein QOZ80_4AG0309910 [Eleusine coracana subsp. coracana]
MTMSTPLLLLSLLAISLSCSGAAPPPPVYDTDGHELNSGDSYYVLPAVHGHGGGLTMAPHMARCPLYVAQDPNELSLGVPVRFTTPAQQDGASTAASATTVRVSSDLSVYFYAETTCVQTTEWHLVGHRSSTGPGVATGPVRDPNPSGREKVFRIEKAAGRVGYKLVSCKDKCQDLGLVGSSADTGRLVWLRASDQAHEVVFKKAPPVFSPPAF